MMSPKKRAVLAIVESCARELVAIQVETEQRILAALPPAPADLDGRRFVFTLPQKPK